VSTQPASIDTSVQIDSGLPVASWQRALRAWQLYYGICRPTVTVDGIFGPLTASATKCFQRIHGLTPDGVVGPQTRQAMCTQLAIMLRFDLFEELSC
jgi:peptidoglycan hydrolase-like protein with peptidoglycan-binding domain